MIIETLVTTHGAKVQSQRARVTLSGESPRKNHRIDSSGLNLSCEGLLLGMWAGGHRDSNTEAHPRIQILMSLRFTMTTATHIHLLRGIESSTRRSLGADRAEDSWHRWEIAPKVVSAPEASGWRWTMAKIIGVSKVLVLDDVARWTCVTSSFVGHENICKSQKIVMTI
jgi:hypothetical protein